MTGILASVKNLQEALLIKALDIDIVDLKQPENGALGALPVQQIKAIVKAVGPEKAISATIGDIPMQSQLVCDAVAAVAGTGVDFIKIGFFSDEGSASCIQALSDFTAKLDLIAVLFADNNPNFALLNSLQHAGFKGVMLDTLNKRKGSLTDALSFRTLAEFVCAAKNLNLICGLAGSLRVNDIGRLRRLSADYLGFRGALCRYGERTSSLDVDQIIKVIQTFSTDQDGCTRFESAERIVHHAF